MVGLTGGISLLTVDGVVGSESDKTCVGVMGSNEMSGLDYGDIASMKVHKIQ